MIKESWFNMHWGYLCPLPPGHLNIAYYTNYRRCSKYHHRRNETLDGQNLAKKLSDFIPWRDVWNSLQKSQFYLAHSWTIQEVWIGVFSGSLYQRSFSEWGWIKLPLATCLGDRRVDEIKPDGRPFRCLSNFYIWELSKLVVPKRTCGLNTVYHITWGYPNYGHLGPSKSIQPKSIWHDFQG